MRRMKPAPFNLSLLSRAPPGYSNARPLKVPAPLSKGGVQNPSDLSPDADEFWDKVVPELERLELVGEANFAGLVAMAECYSRMMQANRIIRVQGVLGHDPDKGRHPAIGVVEEASRNLRGYMASFGILPADEARLGLKKSREEANNPFANGRA